jgi:hypothetical protein
MGRLIVGLGYALDLVETSFISGYRGMGFTHLHRLRFGAEKEQSLDVPNVQWIRRAIFLLLE